MPDEARFLRQVHPSWLDPIAGVAKIAFLPTPKDNDRLSGDDGLRTTPAASHARFTATPGRQSAAVYGLSEGECTGQGCPIQSSPVAGNPDHVHLDFAPLASRGAKERLAKKL